MKSAHAQPFGLKVRLAVGRFLIESPAKLDSFWSRIRWQKEHNCRLFLKGASYLSSRIPVTKLCFSEQTLYVICMYCNDVTVLNMYQLLNMWFTVNKVSLHIVFSSFHGLLKQKHFYQSLTCLTSSFPVFGEYYSAGPFYINHFKNYVLLHMKLCDVL